MNKKSLILVFVIVGIVLTISGSTYSYWKWRSPNEKKTNVSFTTTDGGFSCNGYIDGGGNVTSNDKQLAPSLCTNELAAIKKRIVLQPQLQHPGDTIYMNMWLDVDHIDEELLYSSNFKYALTTGQNSCTDGVLSSGNFMDAYSKEHLTLISDKQYTSNTSDTYYLWIWLDAAEKDVSTMDRSFSISLGGICANGQFRKSVPTFITQNATLDNGSSTYVESTSGIDFINDASDTNGKGVYIRSGTESDPNPIYYYRGDVDDNNVYFANYCWKMVRTTETGGLKLVYNGLPTSESTCDYIVEWEEVCDKYDCWLEPGGGDAKGGNSVKSLSFKNNSAKNNAFRLSYSQYGSLLELGVPFNADETASLGYMYTYLDKDENELIADSTIKGIVDEWYQNNLVDYSSYLEDTVWCDNILSEEEELEEEPAESSSSSSSEGGLNFYHSTEVLFPAYRRVSVGYPSLSCSNGKYTVSANKGNGQLTYPIGLLTIDEAMMAGINSYLQNGFDWWTMSPYMCTEYSSGFYDCSYFYFPGIHPDNYWLSFWDSVVYDHGVRPAISLKAGYTFTYGDGTDTDPYRFVENIEPGPTGPSLSSGPIGTLDPSTGGEIIK